MSHKELEKLIKNQTISDDEILTILKDNLGPNGSTIQLNEVIELGYLSWKLRPSMMKKFGRWYTEEHAKTCPDCGGKVILPISKD